MSDYYRGVRYGEFTKYKYGNKYGNNSIAIRHFVFYYKVGS